jgi:hypothetical protein
MMKRALKVRIVLAALLLQFIPNANAAPIIAFNGLLTGCDTVFSGNNTYAVRMKAYATTTLTAININVGSGLNGNWSTTKYWVVSHNPTSTMPGVILETFTADSTSGSGVNTLVRFTGSYTLNAGTQFYILPSVSFSTFPVCYSNSPPTANLFPNVGINVDTSTSNTNSYWNKVISTGPFPGPNSYSWSAPGSVTQIWQMSLESAAPAPVNVSLAADGGNQISTYRTAFGITATVDTSSRVTFYQSGKKIAGCINILSSGGFANCQWRPTVKGTSTITAIAKPVSGSYTQGSAQPIRILVKPRTSIR